jgi:hypothetical protein
MLYQSEYVHRNREYEMKDTHAKRYTSFTHNSSCFGLWHTGFFLSAVNQLASAMERILHKQQIDPATKGSGMVLIYDNIPSKDKSWFNQDCCKIKDFAGETKLKSCL